MGPTEQELVVCLLDVLGFEERVARIPLDEIHRQYEELLAIAAAKGRSGGFFDVRPAGDGTMVPFFGYLELNYDYFSDTLLLWTPLDQRTLMPFVHVCSSLLCGLLLAEMPIRGALALGRAIMNKDARTYLGQPLVEVARVEKAQRWIGLGLGPSFADRRDVRMRADLIRPYEDHLKPDVAGSIPGLAVDWPRIWRTEQEGSAVPLLERLSRQGRRRDYYDRTIEFVRHSDDDTHWWTRYDVEKRPDGIS